MDVGWTPDLTPRSGQRVNAKGYCKGFFCPLLEIYFVFLITVGVTRHSLRVFYKRPNKPGQVGLGLARPFQSSENEVSNSQPYWFDLTEKSEVHLYHLNWLQ